MHHEISEPEAGGGGIGYDQLVVTVVTRKLNIYCAHFSI